MALAPDGTLTYPGQSQGRGMTDANFLIVFSGEVLTSFGENNIMKGLHRERTITSGKGASFPVIWKANARYHRPGTPILGSNKILHGERIINIDDLLISDVMIYDLDEAKLHYEIRSEYSKQLGAALARTYDRNTMQTAVLAARSGPNIREVANYPVCPGGHQITAVGMLSDSKIMAEAFFLAAEIFDEHDIEDDSRVMVVRPAQYYMLAQDTDLINSLWGGQGAYSDGTILRIAGIPLRKSNNLPKTNLMTGGYPDYDGDDDGTPGGSTTNPEKNPYYGDFTYTAGLCFTKDAIGTVKLRDLKVQKTGNDFKVQYQADLIVASYAMGHGILRPECSIELCDAAAGGPADPTATVSDDKTKLNGQTPTANEGHTPKDVSATIK